LNAINISRISLTIFSVVLSVSASYAASITEGSLLPNYAIVSVGPNASLTINSGPVNGAILLGDGSSANSSGGNNGAITDGVYADTLVLANSMNQLQNSPHANLVASSTTIQLSTTLTRWPTRCKA
jgi:hypothetical protein